MQNSPVVGGSCGVRGYVEIIVKTMDEKYGDGTDHEVCESCGMCITCGDCMCLVENNKCPHCGSESGTWFDRSTVIDGEGNVLEYEDFPDRCNEFGKNVDAPIEYYT